MARKKRRTASPVEWRNNIGALLKLLGLSSRRQLAERVSVAPSTVGDWEKSSTYQPSPKACVKLGNLAASKKGANLARWFWEQAGIDTSVLSKLAPAFAHEFNLRNDLVKKFWSLEEVSRRLRGEGKSEGEYYRQFGKNIVVFDPSETGFAALRNKLVIVEFTNDLRLSAESKAQVAAGEISFAAPDSPQTYKLGEITVANHFGRWVAVLGNLALSEWLEVKKAEFFDTLGITPSDTDLPALLEDVPEGRDFLNEVCESLTPKPEVRILGRVLAQFFGE